MAYTIREWEGRREKEVDNEEKLNTSCRQQNGSIKLWKCLKKVDKRIIILQALWMNIQQFDNNILK